MLQADAPRSWQAVWQRRTLNPQAESVLMALMAADGLDTGFGVASEIHFREFVDRIADRLALQSGHSVFEVGCGSGAFLYPLAEQGFKVGGSDLSTTLIRFAREHLPGGAFEVGDAATLPCQPQYDAVVSCGVFMYFPSLEMAREVIERMVRKAIGRVGILDVPDITQRDAAMAMRRGMLGPAEYEAKYRGLDHLYFDRDWIRDALLAAGATRVMIESAPRRLPQR